ncbi:hypothetical protein Pcinc_039793 [Petrolisthes cinctipes]|uniref:Uncharacterized protein n=1 Tax=Petrolisthes cinctipes TaxID=88211 RepID=A0AAE1EIR2_PETCI|nr:hypothetical protein Pcinc_039793 [Petrolisthes cinctipes]
MNHLQEQTDKQADIIEKQQRFLEAIDRKEQESNVVITRVADKGDKGESLEGATTDQANRNARDHVLEKTSQLKQAGGEFQQIFVKNYIHPNIRKEWRRLYEAKKQEEWKGEEAVP